MAKTKAEQNLVSTIRAELGYRERAGGWTKFAQWYEDNKPAPGFSEGAWCQMLISWAAAQAGIPESVIPRMAYTPYAAQWFQDRGQWGQTPKVNALVYFDWAGSKRIAAIDHVGIVTAVLSDGRIRTLEGNTANELQAHTRSLYGVAGFAYPNYAAAAPKTWMEAIMDELPLLKKGAEKKIANRPHIKTAFKLLDARGYPVGAGVDDTVFGDSMDKKVRELQKAKKLTVDGEIGPKTWTKLVLP
jgi:hypothetical protein